MRRRAQALSIAARDDTTQVRFECKLRAARRISTPYSAWDEYFIHQLPRLAARAPRRHVNVNYGLGHSRRQTGNGLSYYAWDSSDPADLDEVESRTISMDQLMQFETGGMAGHGIFELLVQGDGYTRYPNWAPVRN